MPEELKSLSTIAEPDRRQQSFLCLDSDDNQYRPLDVSDIHKAVSQISINTSAPECVHTAFLTAQHLCIYSWFYYPFNIPASFWATSCVELALKKRLSIEGASFYTLIEKAIERDLLPSDQQEWYQAMRKLRNEMAHGTNMLHNQGITFLKDAAEIINLLYRDDRTQPKG